MMVDSSLLTCSMPSGVWIVGQGWSLANALQIDNTQYLFIAARCPQVTALP
ncbi:hypothetical protein Rcae01_01166 [Novipirellula caenicola]|uniref:Uncharacterized protein n=1 Tax=Novipirellula caenicola TaxID=1536901 RepID=A0ABP9VKL0_9BACT